MTKREGLAAKRTNGNPDCVIEGCGQEARWCWSYGNATYIIYPDNAVPWSYGNATYIIYPDNAVCTDCFDMLIGQDGEAALESKATGGNELAEAVREKVDDKLFGLRDRLQYRRPDDTAPTTFEEGWIEALEWVLALLKQPQETVKESAAATRSEGA